MNLDEAKAIYHDPKGHSRQELLECLKILNSQPHEFTELQVLAIEDAHRRLGVPLEIISEEVYNDTAKKQQPKATIPTNSSSSV